MKKYIIISAILFFCFYSEGMKAEILGDQIINDNFWAEFFLVGCILILTGLAWWLTRNSLRLSEKENVKSIKEGKDWLHQQLYDLDAEQIEVLIKHKTHQMMETKISNEIK